MSEPNCENCYVCQAGVVPSITIEDIKKNDGKIKPEWADEETQGRCEQCYTCQKCYSDQQG